MNEVVETRTDIRKASIWYINNHSFCLCEYVCAHPSEASIWYNYQQSLGLIVCVSLCAPQGGKYLIYQFDCVCMFVRTTGKLVSSPRSAAASAPCVTRASPRGTSGFERNCVCVQKICLVHLYYLLQLVCIQSNNCSIFVLSCTPTKSTARGNEDTYLYVTALTTKWRGGGTYGPHSLTFFLLWALRGVACVCKRFVLCTYTTLCN